MGIADDRPPREELDRIELLWGLRTPPSRGPTRALNMRQIAEVGVRIADTEGLAAVSMQRIAGELKFTKMSLYRYVRSKAELIAAMTDLAIDDPPALESLGDGWRTRIDRFARLIRATWERHPWLPHVSEWQMRPGAVRPTSGERAMGPNEVGWVELGVRTLEGAGLTPAEELDALFLVSAHLRATVAMTTYGVLPWTLGLPAADLLDKLRADHGQRYPALTALAAAGPEPEHNAFEFGLGRILDGIGLLVTSRR
ncbi:MAG TPA: TetR/AcrR family transcriptional regulator [Mycobacteriales bacterium]|nr:TetR/AcrR family transcriptional regulator [Mycobacteriales bacterium]